MYQGRGVLTKRVQEKAVDLIGREITQSELRLFPYLDYALKNDKRMDPIRMNEDERKVLALWRSEGWFHGGAADLEVTKEAFMKIQEILWVAYVDLGEVES